MPRRRSLALLFGLALALATALWSVAPEAGYPDSWYYRAVAREIATGHGFTAPYLWSYVATGGGIDPAGLLPVAAFEHWMPLASLVAVPSLAILGPSPLGYALPFLLAAALIAPLTAILGSRLGLSSRLAMLAGLLAAVPGPFFWWATRSDNFALFALLGNLALWALAEARSGRRPQRHLLLGGVCIALATLARTDGLLLALLIPWAAAAPVPGGMLARLRAAVPGTLLGGGAMLLALAPWFGRQLATFGAPFPSAASGRILWIRDYSELWSADGALAPAHLLDGGLWPLLSGRLEALAWIIGAASLHLAVVLLLPLLLWGIVALWRERGPQARGLMIAFFLHLVWSVGVAAPHVAGGNYVHGLMLYLPLALVAILAGGRRLSARISSQGLGVLGRPSRRAASLVAPAVAVSWTAMSLLCAVAILLPSAQAAEARTRAIAAAIDALALAPDAVVAGVDPGGISALTGHPAILLPRSSIDTTDRALAAYRVEAVVVESRDAWGRDWAAAHGRPADVELTLPDGGTVRVYLRP